MSRKLTFAATALLLASAAPALAQETTAPMAPIPASAEQRAAYDRADPLARSVFWGREAELNPSDPVAGVRLAQALRELGRHDRAAEAAQAVLMVQPGNVEAMLDHQHALGRLGGAVMASQFAQGLGQADSRNRIVRVELGLAAPEHRARRL